MQDYLKPYIIGETAYNHEGDIDYLYRMINEIAELELDAVKFHLLLNADSYFQKNHPLMEVVNKWTFNKSQWLDIIDYSKSKKLDVIALCDDVDSIEFLLEQKYVVKAIEIHASGINDYFLLEAASRSAGEIYLGIGGTTIEEIAYAVNFLKSKNCDNITLMYGFQSYPTDYKHIHFARMIKLQKLFNLPVGYADHTQYNDPLNEIISVMPASMGYNILEKHYTPDYGIERVDFHSAVGKSQMLKIRELMNSALLAYGQNDLTMSEPELKYGNTGPMKKAIVARKKLKKGDILTADKMWFKRTKDESSINQSHFLKLVGLELIADIEEDEIIDFSKVSYKFIEVSIEDFTHVNRNK